MTGRLKVTIPDLRNQSTLIVARYQARITRLEIEQLMGTWEIPE
jgi:hypothetical protein